MSVNNSLSIDCGVRNYCYGSQVCFAAPEGPICGNISSNITTYSWKLNSTVFPPIEYIGNNIGRKQRDFCEMFDYNLWSDENKSWLLTFFYQHWNSNNTNLIPSGSFVKPLDYIGSCSNIIISQNDISLQQLYCDNNRCRKKINPSRQNCVSSNQCLSQLCGLTTINQPADGNITVANTTCISDGFVAYDQLKGGRSFNVILGDEVNIEGGNNNNDNDSKNSSGSMVIIIIILVILFASMAIYGYARKMFKKHDNDDDDTHYLRREIDPETGEIVTISTAGGRLRRGTSLLNNRGGSLNRSNSIRTLPPYTVVDEERPPSTYNTGIVNSIAQFFFPPGELPPPYEENESNNSTVLDITLDEVREGVTIEGNGNGNGNGNSGDGGNGNDSGNGNDNGNGTNSTPPSGRTLVRSTSPRIDDDESHPRELSIISEVIPEVTVDDSEADKVEEGKSEAINTGLSEGKIEEEKSEPINTGLSEVKIEEEKSEPINTGLSEVKIEEGKREPINTGLSEVKIEEGGNETSNTVLSEVKTEEGGSETNDTVEDKSLFDKKMEEGGNETNTTVLSDNLT